MTGADMTDPLGVSNAGLSQDLMSAQPIESGNNTRARVIVFIQGSRNISGGSGKNLNMPPL